MGSVGDFLKHVPDAASSPLAFVAYGLVVAAWVLRTWLLLNPRRHAQKILAQFKDDRQRLDALKQVFNEQPPGGLQGNDAILTWVQLRSREKSKTLAVVAWLATIVAVLLFLVAVNNKINTPVSKEIKIQFRRLGTTGDCPALPIAARLSVAIGKDPATELAVTENCRAALAVPASKTGRALLSLSNSGSYALVDSAATYDLANNSWEVYVTVADQARVRLSLFAYSTVGCADAKSAFDTFETILRAKMLSLRGMFDTKDQRYDYLSNMRVISSGQALDMSAQEIRDYWQKTASLQILSGLCFRRDGAEFMRSQVFFGALGMKLSEPFVAELPIAADQFGATRDVHTASILYALAQDAVRRGLDHDVTIAYLARAREVVSQIHDDAAKQLLDAIDTALGQIGAPQRMAL